MTPFIALYYGESPRTANVIAVSIAPELIRDVVEYLLAHPDHSADSVQSVLQEGRCRALQRLLREVEDGLSSVRGRNVGRDE
jgi:hypothetical protein